LHDSIKLITKSQRGHPRIILPRGAIFGIFAITVGEKYVRRWAFVVESSRWTDIRTTTTRGYERRDGDIYVDIVRDGALGNGAAHRRREICLSFDVQGSVAKASPGCVLFASGLVGGCISVRSMARTFRFGRCAVAEVYRALWSHRFTREYRTGDYSIATWFSRAGQDGGLAAFLKPDLTPPNAPRCRSRNEYWDWRNTRN
jgi:hypothetical protein